MSHLFVTRASARIAGAEKRRSVPAQRQVAGFRLQYGASPPTANNSSHPETHAHRRVASTHAPPRRSSRLTAPHPSALRPIHTQKMGSTALCARRTPASYLGVSPLEYAFSMDHQVWRTAGRTSRCGWTDCSTTEMRHARRRSADPRPGRPANRRTGRVHVGAQVNAKPDAGVRKSAPAAPPPTAPMPAKLNGPRRRRRVFAMVSFMDWTNTGSGDRALGRSLVVDDARELRIVLAPPSIAPTGRAARRSTHGDHVVDNLRAP